MGGITENTVAASCPVPSPGGDQTATAGPLAAVVPQWQGSSA